ncbi:MAG TPA: hypothetical protein VJ203_03395 [Bacteroidales bacterium]|nr:hypothetical protein [Bacteroidales bacterium]
MSTCPPNDDVRQRSNALKVRFTYLQPALLYRFAQRPLHAAHAKRGAWPVAVEQIIYRLASRARNPAEYINDRRTRCLSSSGALNNALHS